MYDWTRFWAHRERRIQYEVDGFLVDPSIAFFGVNHNSGAEAVEFQTDIPCLVLLGEPGLGKTTTLASQRGMVEASLESIGVPSLWINLHEIGSETQLFRELFETDEFGDWL